MRIAAVRDAVVPIASAIANAYIDFCQMTASVVAVRSTSRSRAGRDRLRLQLQWPLRPARAAERTVHPATSRQARLAARCRGRAGSGQVLGRDDGEREAGRPWRALGGGRRARHGAVGCASAKAKRRAALEAVGRPLQRRQIRRQGLGLRRRRLLLPRQGSRRAAGRDEALSRPRLFLREDEGGRRAARPRTSSASRRC